MGRPAARATFGRYPACGVFSSTSMVFLRARCPVPAGTHACSAARLRHWVASRERPRSVPAMCGCSPQPPCATPADGAVPSARAVADVAAARIDGPVRPPVAVSPAGPPVPGSTGEWWCRRRAARTSCRPSATGCHRCASRRRDRSGEAVRSSGGATDPGRGRPVRLGAQRRPLGRPPDPRHPGSRPQVEQVHAVALVLSSRANRLPPKGAFFDCASDERFIPAQVLYERVTTGQ
ncbi:hypothetical protein GA0070561_4848 [Micromonospora saelicesensis]|uniref:Uncharacterized protein n=1 Tax=Micromonospora saelicesensis TaxID=285676 RepID=A0A1C4Z2L3_9ACTN|nr:hypothetical protein GA0070561_4848 [Micromonospora saelicesensis]